MGFLSFGSKKSKIKKLIEEERFDEIVAMAVKDRKAFNSLLELLDDPNPGIVGDTLLILTNVLDTSPSAAKPYLSEAFFRKLMRLMERKNPYVRENAMMLSYKIVTGFPEITSKHRGWMVDVIRRGLTEGTKDQKGFLLMVVGELGLSELRQEVEELVNVQDKVILPFEGKKWIPLGEIAKETLEKLS
ncbi:hypothetical protein [Thermococcus sp. ES12]|uniref:hypothetical protein n=1 Tax=Thermococcus sp. ES12 TaxID=1638246 RepID=UPI00142F4679|nr:hypothetical protein [Thermococcus sp. ES12]NJE75776.1 hypothetical protein [Thermococcus sp. ES12]